MIALRPGADEQALSKVESLATFVTAVASTARGAGFLIRRGAAEQLVACWAAADPSASSTTQAISRALIAMCTRAAGPATVRRLLSLAAGATAPAQTQVLQVLRQMYEKGASSGWVAAAPSACLDLRGSDAAPGPGQEQAAKAGWLEPGRHASLTLPVPEIWPADGYSLVSWVRLEQPAASGPHTAAAHRPLLTFSSGHTGWQLGVTGQEPQQLVLRLTANAAAPSVVQQVLPPALGAESWYHIALVHRHPGNLLLYINGKSGDSIEIPYPKIGLIARSYAGHIGSDGVWSSDAAAPDVQLGNTHLLDEALSADRVASAFRAGESDTWLNGGDGDRPLRSRCSFVAAQVALAWQASESAGAIFKGSGNVCSLGDPSLRSTLDCGTAALLPQVVSMFGVVRAAAPLGALFVFVAELVRVPAARVMCTRANLIAKIACFLHNWSAITDDVIGAEEDCAALISGMQVFLSSFQQGSALWVQAQKNLAWNMQIWAYYPDCVQYKLFEMLTQEVHAQPQLFREKISASFVLDMCRLCYYKSQPDKSAIPGEIERGGTLCIRPRKELHRLRVQLLAVVNAMMHDEPSPAEINAIVGLALHCKDDGLVQDALRLLIQLSGGSNTRGEAAVHHLNAIGCLHLMLSCILNNTSENTDVLALRLMSRCIMSDDCHISGLEGVVSALTTALASRPFTQNVLRGVMEFVASSGSFRVPSGLRAVFVLATETADDIRQASLAQLQAIGGKELVCAMLSEMQGYNRLLVEFACSPRGTCAPGERADDEAAKTVVAVADLLSSTLLLTFHTEGGRLIWQSTVFCFSEACREPGQPADLGKLLCEMTHLRLLDGLKQQAHQAAIDTSDEGPGDFWINVCFLLARTQWKKAIETFSDQNPNIRSEIAGLVSSLAVEVVAKFQDGDCMQVLNIPIKPVEEKTLFDVVLMTMIQALLLKRHEDLVDSIQTLFQLELDDGDEDVLLVDGRLAFCVANMLKCLSTDGRSGRTAADATVAACDNRLVELLSDVLMLRWDSLSEIMVDASGVRLMDDLSETPPHPPVSEFATIMFGAAWRPVLGQMGKRSLESAKHFVLQNQNDYDNKKTEIALNEERETHCVLQNAALATLAGLPVASNVNADAQRLRWVLPQINTERCNCAAALAELTQMSSTPAIWQIDSSELTDRSRVRISRVWGGTNHMDAARVPPDEGSAEGGSTGGGSYRDLVDALHGLRKTTVDPNISEHALLLEQLWTLLMPGHPGVPGKDGTRSAEDWTKLGFQSANPSSDFRAMGLLALKNLVSFASTHNEEAALIVSAAQSDPEAHYPFAITAINVTGWLYSMMENHSISEDHFASTESLGMTFSGFTIDRVHELYSQSLLRFDQFWKATAPESVMHFSRVSTEFQESLWDLGACGRLCDSPGGSTGEQQETSDQSETDDVADDHEAYQEEIRKIAEATETALKTAEESQRAEVMSIFDMDVDDALAEFAGGDAGVVDPHVSFSETVDVTVDEAKAQLDAAKAQVSAKFSSFGKKAAEKTAVARATAHKKALEAEKRARSLSEGAQVLGDRISTTASHVAGEAITRADSIAKRNVVDLSQFHQSRCEVECIWENERRIMRSWRSSYLLQGSDFHSWTNKVGRARIRLSGKPFVSKDDLQIDTTWCWLSEWHTDVVDGHTDSNGFTYAPTFSTPLDSWDAEPNACHHVRRRCWFRLRHPTVPNALSPPKLVAHRAQDIARVLLDRNESQLKRLRGWFDELDENGVGSLDRDAIESLLIKVGKTLGGQDLDQAVADMDRTNSGRVDYVDFCDWWQSMAGKGNASDEPSSTDLEPESESKAEPEPECQGPECELVSADGPTVSMKPEHTLPAGLVKFEEACELITPSKVITGSFAVLRSKKAVFLSETGAMDQSWAVDSIMEAYRRRYMMQWKGLELKFSDTTTVLLNFSDSDGANKRALEAIVESRTAPLRRTIFDASAQAIELEKLRSAWSAGALSNFDYLMQLNTLASRTYSDLSQYPVFPWVLRDYSSATLDLLNPTVYRDLSKPIGALNEGRLQKFLSRAEAIRDMPDMPFFLYGTHYSNLGAITSFLLRLEPFTSIHVGLQSGSFDSPDRLFHSIPLAWKAVNSNMADLKELPPEFYCCPDFLLNSNQLPLGQMQSGAIVDDVVLPVWAASPAEFIRTHRAALESDHVSAHLHEWIDLIFGYKQRGDAAEAAHNVFYHLTYEGAVDLDSLSDPVAIESIKSQIANFGQTPVQIFSTPHPPRGGSGITRPLAESSSLLAHATPPVKVSNTAIISLCSSHDGTVLALDTEGQCFACQPPASVFSFSCSMKNACTTSIDLALGATPLLAAGTRLQPVVLCTGPTPTACLARTGEVVDVLKTHTGATTCYAVEQYDESDLIVAGSVDGTLSLWQAAHSHGVGDPSLLIPWGGLAEQLPCYVGAQVTAVAISSSFDLLVAGCADGSVHTVRISNPTQVINTWSVADGLPVCNCAALNPISVLHFGWSNLVRCVFSYQIRWLQISRAQGHIVCATTTGIFLHTINATLLASVQASFRLVALVMSSEAEGEVLVTGAARLPLCCCLSQMASILTNNIYSQLKQQNAVVILGEGNDVVVRLVSRLWLREVSRASFPAGMSSVAPVKTGLVAGLSDGSVARVSLSERTTGL